MKKDPSQKTDIASEHPEVVSSMRDAYEKFWKETRPLMVNEKVPMSLTQPFHVLHAKQLEKGGIPDWKEPKI
jgi:arylsulfatase